MEPNGLGGGIFSNMSSAMLGVDNSSHPQQQQNHHHHLHTNPQMVSYTDNPPPHNNKHGYPFPSKSLSDEEEPGFAADDISGDHKSKTTSPWQRMKWTDTMVRLLIMAVYYIGDEAVSDGTTEPTGKKKPAGLLQKKGKWKSVSRAMMEKGFYVSPQQCEDKFNDLNKRYKRVNDILGRGTACRVVENQSLLDTMDLSAKMKEEARKLLNSKHLFFREMCAYHNSCGHGNNAAQPETAAAPVRQQCSHTTENGLRVGSMEDDSEFESESESEGFSEEEEDESVEQEEENLDEIGRKRKRRSAAAEETAEMGRLRGEVAAVMEEGGKSGWEKKEWMKRRVMQMEEQQVRYKMRGFDLEKQRLKWARFSSKKEREMERAKLENERRKLETERMLLMIRQKEIELMTALHHQQQQQQHSSN